eukprot:13260072-Ditylum_brightwellii.AAC.2
MYINIDVDHYITTTETWLRAHKDKLPDDFPTELIIKALTSLTLVMKSNVFSFRDTWWVQLIGVAMGSPCALWQSNNNINASNQAFENFKQDVDKFGILRWKTESLAKL